MIAGIGTDIIEIKRFENLHENFFHKHFTDNELSYLLGKKTESVAGIFAAKEAVSKALGTGFRGFTALDVEILSDAPGCPRVVLYRGALEIATKTNIKICHVTISHCRDYAVAYAIAEVE